MKFYALGITNAVLALLAAWDVLLTDAQQGALIGAVNVAALAGDAAWSKWQSRQAKKAQ